MKKICLLVVFVFIVGLSQSPLFQALHSEPAGKNLMNPAHFYTDDTTIYTTTPLDVEPHTTYTFAIPTIIGASIEPGLITISQSGTILVDASVNTNDAVCAPDAPYGIEKLICTFETVDKTTLDIEITGDIDPRIGLQDLEHIQLEEGSTYTEYEPFEAKTEPVFEGQGLLVLDYHDTLFLNEIIGTHITAYDEIDGDLTDDIIVVSDAYTGHESTVGEYLVKLEVYDSSGNGAAFDLTIVIQDTVPPEIIGHNVIYTEVDDQVLLDTLIQDHFEFYDEHDGVIDDYTLHYDHYTGAEDTLGDKEVHLEIEDSSGNKSDIVFRVRIEDNTPPVIEGPTHVKLYLSEGWLEPDIVSLFNVTDNYTNPQDIDVFITSNHHPETYDAIGEYQMTLKAIDESGNETLADFTLEIIDDVPPSLSGPYLEEISYQDTLDLDGYSEHLEVSDNHCDLSYHDIQLLEDNYQASSPGDYTATYVVYDSSGNQATYTLNIRVIDDVPPSFNLDQTIVVSSNTEISEDEILTYFKNLIEEETLDMDSYEIFHNEYQGHEHEAGIYEVGINMRDTLGNNYQETLLIEVTEIEAKSDYTWAIWPIGIAGVLISIILYKRKF